MTPATRLANIYNAIKDILGDISFCVAGGAVRDALVGLDPKDYDIFVFGSSKDWIKKKLDSRLGCGQQVALHPSSASDLVSEYSLLDCPVQVMVTQSVMTPRELIDGHDWAICQYAYTSDGIISSSTAQVPMKDAELILRNWRFPQSTLDRGRRFADRFKMHLNPATVEFLQSEVQSKKSADDSLDLFSPIS